MDVSRSTGMNSKSDHSSSYPHFRVPFHKEPDGLYNHSDPSREIYKYLVLLTPFSFPFYYYLGL